MVAVMITFPRGGVREHSEPGDHKDHPTGTPHQANGYHIPTMDGRHWTTCIAIILSGTVSLF